MSKRIRIENNTLHTLKIKSIEFNKKKSPSNKTKTEIANMLLGGYQFTEERYNINNGFCSINPFYPSTNKNFHSSNPDYCVIVEIINQNDVVIVEIINQNDVVVRRAMMEIGEIWSINNITEEQITKTVQEEIHQEVDIKKSKSWFRFLHLCTLKPPII